MKIILLHGLASVGTGPKYDSLKKEFGNDVYSPNLPLHPNAVESLITNIVESLNNAPMLFIGTSLGGFWANYFAHKYNSRCILVNPCISPSYYLKSKVGLIISKILIKNIGTIVDDYLFEFEMREQFINRNLNNSLIHLFLSKDDRILPYKKTLSMIKDPASCFIFEDGGHQFDSYWHYVVDQVKHIENMSHSTVNY